MHANRLRGLLVDKNVVDPDGLSDLLESSGYVIENVVVHDGAQTVLEYKSKHVCATPKAGSCQRLLLNSG